MSAISSINAMNNAQSNFSIINSTSTTSSKRSEASGNLTTTATTNEKPNTSTTATTYSTTTKNPTYTTTTSTTSKEPSKYTQYVPREIPVKSSNLNSSARTTNSPGVMTSTISLTVSSGPGTSASKISATSTQVKKPGEGYTLTTKPTTPKTGLMQPIGTKTSGGK